MTLNYQRIDHLSEVLSSAITGGIFTDVGTAAGPDLNAKAIAVRDHLEELLASGAGAGGVDEDPLDDCECGHEREDHDELEGCRAIASSGYECACDGFELQL